jgi:hypothetical protein
MTNSEEWRPVPGYEGRYEASDHGNVRSVGFYMRNPHGTQTWKPGRTLKPTPHRQGYRMVTLIDESGKRRSIKVPRVVLLTFVGPPPPGKEDALHGDDDPTNDHLGNLRWGDQSENSYDSVENDCHPQSRKRRCIRGHLLVAPNLVPSAAGRQCLACKRTHSARTTDARRMPNRFHRGADGFLRRHGESFEDEAGRRYAHIMRNYEGGL